MGKKIMILGAGINQVSLIEKAKLMGLDTFVVSYAGPYPGIAIADHFLELSTTDTDGILNAAKKIKIDAVMTVGTDVCIPTIGTVCDELNLPGVTRRVADIFSLKGNFKQFMEESGLCNFAFHVGKEWEEVKSHLQKMKLPLYFKPVDSSGSRGINRLESFDEETAHRFFHDAKMHSISGTVCVEEGFPGIDISGDAVIWNGKLTVLIVTVKFIRGCFVRGHFLPTNLDENQLTAISTKVEQICEKTGFVSGTMNFDMTVDGNSIYVIEIGARLGGNGISDIIQRAFDYDIEQDAIRIALGEAPFGNPLSVQRGCACTIFGASQNGTLKSLTTFDELKSQCPYVWGMRTGIHSGDKVVKMENNAQQLGFVLFDCLSSEMYDKHANEIIRTVCVEVV
jgi:biotin carboxylase